MYKAPGGLHVLIGVVSFGPQGCLDPDLPNVFARITEALVWIFSVMKTDVKTCLPNENDLEARLNFY